MSLQDRSGKGLNLGTHTHVTASRNTIFEILSNQRRRRVLEEMRDRDEPMDIGSLAERVAAWENETTVDDVTYEERKRVYTALQQSHLPKMDEAGALQFDKARGTITPTDGKSEFEVYLEVVQHSGRPKSEYYVGLGLFSLVLGLVAALGLYPVRLIPPVGLIGISVGLFGLSALAHLYALRQSNSTSPHTIETFE